MEYTGKLITADFKDNTMTFEIEGEMTIQAGRYKITQIEVGNKVENNVVLDNVSDSFCDCIMKPSDVPNDGYNYICNKCKKPFKNDC